MTETTRENVLFFLTIANIVAGVVSITLATLAILVLRQLSKKERHLDRVFDSLPRADTKLLDPRTYWRDTATEIKPPVRPSTLARYGGQHGYRN